MLDEKRKGHTAFDRRVVRDVRDVVIPQLPETEPAFESLSEPR